MIFNGDRVGDFDLNSTYDMQKNAISVDASIISKGQDGNYIPIVVSGYYYPDNKDNNLDINAEVNNLNLKWFSRYLSDFASDFNGFATGKLKFSGKTDNPELTGKLDLQNSRLKIDYLNIAYYLSGEIIFNKNDMTFNNLLLSGTNPNEVHSAQTLVHSAQKYSNTGKAILSGKIYHKFFSKMVMDLDIKLQNLACLNTTIQQNNLYYGKALATGNIKISGNISNILMNIDAKTEKGTKLCFPLTIPGELSENEFVSFIDKGQKKTKSLSYNVNTSGLQLNFNLEVTPDAEVQIVFDPKLGDVIKAHGIGNLKLEINTNGDFDMYGDYEVVDGDYLFTLKNLINKKFKIEKGGKITWNGSPYAGIINLQATYTLRTSVDPLRPDLPPTNKNIPVYCNILLSDQLLKPTITPSITFQENLLDISLEPYKSAIETDLNQQVFSLLVLTSFTTPQQYTTNLSNSIFGNDAELLSSQLSNWLSQISKTVDLGVNYKPGDQLTTDQVNVTLATQVFNNRLIISSNLGMGGEKRQATETSNNIVGDVNMEYKLSPEGDIRLKAYNKSNINDYLEQDIMSPYTQGLGIFYRKEFDHFGEFFRRKEEKSK